MRWRAIYARPYVLGRDKVALWNSAQYRDRWTAGIEATLRKGGLGTCIDLSDGRACALDPAAAGTYTLTDYSQCTSVPVQPSHILLPGLPTRCLCGWEPCPSDHNVPVYPNTPASSSLVALRDGPLLSILAARLGAPSVLCLETEHGKTILSRGLCHAAGVSANIKVTCSAADPNSGEELAPADNTMAGGSLRTTSRPKSGRGYMLISRAATTEYALALV